METKRISEKELLLPALKIISKYEKGLSTTQLINELRKEMNPTGEDLILNKNRNDDAFSQKVRNLISHKTITNYVNMNDNNMCINPSGLDYISDFSDDEYSVEIEQNDDFREENSGYVVPEKTVELDNLYLSVSDLKRKYDRYKQGIEENALKLDPEFQRKDGVWSRKNKSLFIESILLNIPIPSIYLSEDSKGNLIVIDGRQRLSTLFAYMNDEFPLSGLSILEDLNRKKYSKLTGQYAKYKSKIEDRSLHVAKIRYGTDDTFVIETFERVNTKGARLNAQEIRNAMYQGKCTKLLNNISDHYMGDNEIIDKKRMKDKYLVLRYLAMRYFYNNLVKNKNLDFKSISDYLSNIMKYINGLDDNSVLLLEKNFIRNYDRAIKIWGKESAFRLHEGKPINMILFEIALLIIDVAYDVSDSQIANIFERFINYNNSGNEKGETLFELNIKYHRDSKENIKERLTWIKELTKGF